MPREWLANGNTISAESVPTKWGRVGFSIESQLKKGKVEATLNLPSDHFKAMAKIRLRTPGNIPLRSVSLNGKPWANFSAEDETITIPPQAAAKIDIVADY